MPRRATGRSAQAAAPARASGRAAEREALLAARERIAALERGLAERDARSAGRDAALAEALEQQRATADVLKAISRSPTDLPGVLDALVDSAARLCGASGVFLTEIDGDRLRTLAAHGPARDPVAQHRAMCGARRGVTGDGARTDRLIEGVPFSRGTFSGRAVIERRTVHVTDAATAVEGEYADARESQSQWQYQTIIAVALLRQGTPIGALSAFRAEARPFTDGQIALLETFADQAVIAIENARLFTELNESNASLREALEQQTATAEVLQTISRSPTELQAVLDTIADSAARLCDAPNVNLFLVEGDRVRSVAGQDALGNRRTLTAPSPSGPLDRRNLPGRAIIDRAVLHIPDRSTIPDSEIIAPVPTASPARSSLLVPLLAGERALGVISVARREVRPFTDREIALLQTFADQAAIAIENARLFAEIQAKNRQLEEASRHKSAFLAAMSHELRTPLNAIIGYAEMLAEEMQELGAEAMRADLARIDAAGQHLLSLINAVLDLSKIEAGRMELDLEEFALADLVAEVRVIAAPLVEQQGNAFAVECDRDAGRMRADRTKLRQSVLNLLSNAAKFTQQGTVTLRVGRDGEWVSVAVGDTGIGMSADQVGRLFQEFSQAEASTSRSYGGTGLGLALSRRFCRLMGGDVTVESALGRGSTFTIRLPAVVPETAAPTTAG
jgi:signal transduction histidine kinase